MSDATQTRQRILHLDMDAFFAAVEALDNPQLAGKPVLVGGAGPRGVVAACSYEARRFGIHSAMPMRRARERCPDALIVPARKGRYGALSREIFGWIGDKVDRLEKMSVDEAYLDIGHLPDDPTALEFGRMLKQGVHQKFGLVCSIGIAPCKFVAKIASDLEKPDALVLVRPEELQEFIAPLSVGKIPGVGKVGLRKLHARGIETIAQLRQEDRGNLVHLFGKWGWRLYDYARGIDPRPVIPEHERKSLGTEETFDGNVGDLNILADQLRQQAEKIAARLEKESLYAHTVTLKVRYTDFTTLTRQSSFDHPIRDAQSIAATARELLSRTQAGQRPLRLIGLSVSGFIEGHPPDELPLFTEPPPEDGLPPDPQ